MDTLARLEVASRYKDCIGRRLQAWAERFLESEKELADMLAYREACNLATKKLMQAFDEPLVVNRDGKIQSGVFWIGLAPTAAKVRRKPATKASTLQKWAVKMAGGDFDYAA